MKWLIRRLLYFFKIVIPSHMAGTVLISMSLALSHYQKRLVRNCCPIY